MLTVETGNFEPSARYLPEFIELIAKIANRWPDAARLRISGCGDVWIESERGQMLSSYASAMSMRGRASLDVIVLSGMDQISCRPAPALPTEPEREVASHSLDPRLHRQADANGIYPKFPLKNIFGNEALAPTPPPTVKVIKWPSS